MRHQDIIWIYVPLRVLTLTDHHVQYGRCRSYKEAITYSRKDIRDATLLLLA